ncbi:MAG TPA: phosphate ABC transporter permease PstA [Acidimicrobiales bacterium]
MTDLLYNLPPDPILERRAAIQRLAAQSLRRRQSFSRGFEFAMAIALIISLIPLVSILYSLISKGWRYLSIPFISGLPPKGYAVLSSIGGIRNAVIGTVVIVGLAAIVAIPVGITTAIYLSESNGRVANTLRAAVEIMTGMPSILLGVFAAEIIVTRMNHQYSGIAGSFALSILIVPVIAKSSELALRGVPQTLREAGLALGARPSKVTRGIILPAALPGIITGTLLSLARAMGETAPVLLVTGYGSGILNLNPLGTMISMPLQIYKWNQFPDPTTSSQEESAVWGVALILVLFIMVLSIGSRLVAARMRRERR